MTDEQKGLRLEYFRRPGMNDSSRLPSEIDVRKTFYGVFYTGPGHLSEEPLRLIILRM